MKMEHVELVWESLAQFEKDNLTFGDFIDRLGKSLETATLKEAKLIGEATRELDFSLSAYPGENEKVMVIISKLKSGLISQLKSTAN